MAKEIVISTSKVNSYWTRVITAGIDTSQYRRNPILLWQHSRPWRGDAGEVLPIGRIDNLRVDGDRLIGTPVFDAKDEFARRIAAKFNDGFLRMASAGLDIVETSTDARHIVPGQRRATITKCKLVEVSIVYIGANDDALALYRDSRLLELAAGGNEVDALLPLLLTETNPKNQLNNQKKMENVEAAIKAVALKLGLAETATEAGVLAAIGTLQATAGETVRLKKEVEDARNKAVESELDAALKLNKITAGKRDHFIALGKAAGLDSLRATLECMMPAVKPTDVLSKAAASTGAGAVGETKYKKLGDVQPAERIELRKNNLDEYKRLYNAEYGVAAEI